MIEPRFLCDEMLHRLARWLRTAGYDTATAVTGLPDRDLLARAVAENRWVVTRDRALLEHRAAAGRTVLLKSDTVAGQARELARTLPIDWLARAFTRCTVCNTPLRPATAAESAAVPDTVRRGGRQVHLCTGCGRLYWAGGHEARMRAALSDFARDA